MSNEKRTGAKALAREAVLDAVVPFRQLLKSIGLFHSKAKERRSELRYLADTAQETLLPGADSGATTEPSFQEAMASRRDGALSISQLRAHFLLRKRTVLVVATVLLGVGCLGAAAAARRGDWLSFGLSLTSVMATAFAAFAVALSAQLRIWQLDNKRLSKAERGCLDDFKAENPNWFWLALSPEFGGRHGHNGGDDA